MMDNNQQGPQNEYQRIQENKAASVTLPSITNSNSIALQIFRSSCIMIHH